MGVRRRRQDHQRGEGEGSPGDSMQGTGRLGQQPPPGTLEEEEIWGKFRLGQEDFSEWMPHPGRGTVLCF